MMTEFKFLGELPQVCLIRVEAKLHKQDWTHLSITKTYVIVTLILHRNVTSSPDSEGPPSFSYNTPAWKFLVHTHTHTHHEHTPGAVGSQCCSAWGAFGGSVPCSRVSPQSWYWGWRERWTFTPPTHNPTNPQPSGYKSDSLSIRPRIIHIIT